MEHPYTLNSSSSFSSSRSSSRISAAFSNSRLRAANSISCFSFRISFGMLARGGPAFVPVVDAAEAYSHLRYGEHDVQESSRLESSMREAIGKLRAVEKPETRGPG